MLIGFGGTQIARKEATLGAESGGADLHGPHHHSRGVGIDALGCEDAADLGLVEGKVAERLGDAEPWVNAATAGSSHVVKASTGHEVMTAAGTAANRGTQTVAAGGEDVATSANDEVRIH